MKKTITVQKVICTCDVCGMEISEDRSHIRCAICGRMICYADVRYVNITDINRVRCCPICSNMSDEYLAAIKVSTDLYASLRDASIEKTLRKWAADSIEGIDG